MWPNNSKLCGSQKDAKRAHNLNPARPQSMQAGRENIEGESERKNRGRGRGKERKRNVGRECDKQTDSQNGREQCLNS